jgi:hypothetical protein
MADPIPLVNKMKVLQKNIEVNIKSLKLPSIGNVTQLKGNKLAAVLRHS